MTWTLWDGGRARAEHGEARATASALRTRVDDFDRQVDLRGARSARWSSTSSRAAIAAADDGVRAATEAERVVGERFRAGVATSTDVLDAQVALLQAELDRTRAVANVRLARSAAGARVGR